MRTLTRLGSSLKRRLRQGCLRGLTAQINLYGKLFSSLAFKQSLLIHDTLIWMQNDFQIPSPPNVKRSVLKRNGIPGANWIETGTYLGETSFYLSKCFSHVTTIEPNADLYKRAKAKYKDIKNIEFILGASETRFEQAMQNHSGKLNIFLDGHYSGGITSRTDYTTPLLIELDTIVSHIDRFDEIRLFIDDIRCMNPEIEEFSEYPSLNLVLNKINGISANVSIQHDILCLTLIPSKKI